VGSLKYSSGLFITTHIKEKSKNIMAEVCSKCGLPKDLCVCGTISMEQQLVKIRLETRKWGKPTTIVEGVDSRAVDLGELAGKLKAYCACGGTAKDNQIILQGDHRSKVRKVLVECGFPESSIEIR
jgi:translation initiation factor 1